MVSAIVLVVTLLWLTVSTPFVFASQQHLAKQSKAAQAEQPVNAGDEESANPFGNTTEEKAPSGNSFSEEFLHDSHSFDYFISVRSQYQKCEDADTYHAFHGELLVPPPNVA